MDGKSVQNLSCHYLNDLYGIVNAIKVIDSFCVKAGCYVVYEC